MNKKLVVVLGWGVGWWLLAGLLPNQVQALVISGVTDNSGLYSGGQVPKYEKLEITFAVSGTVAKNLQFSYDPNPPAGELAEDQGISVDAQFLPPGQSDWNQALSQPAFYYQNFQTATHSSPYGVDWYYPTGTYDWKIRFAPKTVGRWQYRLVATDASGSVTSAPAGFNVSDSSSHGYVRVSQADHRYFEFEDGTYFPALGYNMNYDHIQWVNPEAIVPNNTVGNNNNPTNFQVMGQNGVQLIRMWLSQWSIFGSHWNPWREINSNGFDPPWTWLSYSPGTNPQSEFSIYIGAAGHPCLVYGLNTPHVAVKPGTKYRVRISYQTGKLNGQAGAGLVVKLTGDTNNCTSPTVGTKITPVATTNTTDWQILEGSYTTGSGEYFLPFITLAIENNPDAWAEVRYLWIEEDLGGGQYGPNVVYKPSMDHHRYFDQRNSLAFDKVVDMAMVNGVYLKPVILDFREEILGSLDNNGQYVNPPDPTNLFGPDDPNINNRSRWLERQWWRYLQARWGYSPAIQSWEYVNEGNPGAIGHAAATEAMGKYFHQFADRHMVSTSVWSGSTGNWWGLNNPANYPDIDFADVHCYIRQTGSACVPLSTFYDEAEASIQASNTWGVPYLGGARPIIRGETGFVLNDNLAPTSELQKDTNGVWLHNFYWAGLNANALIDLYWYENVHINCTWSYWCTSPFDHRPEFKPLADFLADIPLNKGGYQDTGATGFNTVTTRVVGQKNTAAGKAHLWIQNKKHTWCAVAGGISGCPVTWDNSRLSGMVTIAGFVPNAVLPVNWWYFDTAVNLTRPAQSTVTVDASGQITLDLNSLPATVTDAGVKIGDYMAGPVVGPSPTPLPRPGDANGDGRVDGIDYVIWLNHYNTTGSGPAVGDFNNDGRVDGVDYVIWLNNYG